MAAFLDACRFVPTSGGTTDFTYSSAITGFQSPASAGAVNGKLYKYRAESTDLTQWEIGEGAYNTGTGVLARTTVLYNSSNTGTLQGGGGTKISFTATPQVAIVAVKAELLNFDEAQTLTTTQKSQAKTNLKISGPTVQELTAGSNATYTRPTGCTRIRVRGVGAGGGSGNTGASGQTDGTSTTFSDGTLTLTGSGGAKGTGVTGTTSVGGSGTNGQPNHRGADGTGTFTSATAGFFYPAQPGGGTFLFPTGGRHGAAAAANTGAGGGAPNIVNATSSIGCGAGGGGFERWIDAPATSWTYTIGTAGAAGTGGYAGAAGYIIVEEFYD